MRQFLAGITRREAQFAAAGIATALVVCMPLLATADPGTVPGSGPGNPADSGTEQALDVERGDSCRGLLPADTPHQVVCRWLTPPQDAAEVAAFWAAGDGANLQAAQPLAATYVRCNQKTDLSKESVCKGGQTTCAQRTDGWYECRDLATGTTTYERTTDGRREVHASLPTASATVRPSRPATTASAPAPSTSSPAPSADPDESTPPGTAPPATAGPSAAADPAEGDPAVIATATARAAQMRIWVESDLADDFLAGEARFRAALKSLAWAARQPGVTGVKFADNLAYSGFTSSHDVETFLRRATGALRQAVPGKRLAIGVVVPELGCGAAKACITAMRAKAPLATKKLVERYLKAAAVEQVYVSTGLFAAAYRQHRVSDQKTEEPQPITPALATRAQWLSIKALGWDTLAQISSREYGLAHSGPTAAWGDAQAAAQINARIGTVIGLGAPTVTLWGHRAVDGDRTYRLLDAGLAMNPVWSQLIRQGLRERLAVVFDPRATELGIRQDITALGKAAGEIFIVV